MDKFANATSLCINWAKSDARWLAKGDCPPATDSLDLLWRANNNPRELFGFSFSTGLTGTDSASLEKLQKHLVAFVWSNRRGPSKHRISASILVLPRAQGGLVLINVPVQARALGSCLFLWALHAAK
jgi:hypothetical protein